jgi:hypothetical protein
VRNEFLKTRSTFGNGHGHFGHSLSRSKLLGNYSPDCSPIKACLPGNLSDVGCASSNLSNSASTEIINHLAFPKGQGDEK